MKNVFAKFILILVPILVFNGCGFSKYFKDDPDVTSLTGILTEQTVNDNESGTHFLTDEVGNITALRSLSINLSSVRYLNNKVSVLGVMNENENVFEVTGLSVIEVLSAEREKIGEFIEYKNSKLGIKIKYYNDWNIAESNDDRVIFYAPQITDKQKSLVSRVESVEISKIPYEYSPAVSDENQTPANPILVYLDEDMPLEKLGIDQLDTVKYESEDGAIEYYLYRSGLIYSVKFIKGSSETYESNKKIFNEMLSEFRFIPIGENTETSVQPGNEENLTELGALPNPPFETSLFESLPYHFGTSYPADWYYSGSSSSEEGVLRHYGFSDEPIDENNELISLDVISSSIPSGKKLPLENLDAVEVEAGGIYTIFVTLDSIKYRVSGSKDYQNEIFWMAVSLHAIADTAAAAE